MHEKEQASEALGSEAYLQSRNQAAPICFPSSIKKIRLLLYSSLPDIPQTEQHLGVHDFTRLIPQ